MIEKKQALFKKPSFFKKKNLLDQVFDSMRANVKNLPLVESEDDLIFSEGNPDADIFLIGEAAGLQEYLQKRPFVGRSGQLLRKSIVESAKLDLNLVYITNLIKARPPENRDPTTDEIESYSHYLDQEIKIVDPKLIITLGRFSMQKFLKDVQISKVHGQLHQIDFLGKKINILPMYHPAAALRSNRVRKDFLADFAQIRNFC